MIDLALLDLSFSNEFSSEEPDVQMSYTVVEEASMPDSDLAQTSFISNSSNDNFEDNIEIIFGLVEDPNELPPELLEEPLEVTAEAPQTDERLRLVNLKNILDGINSLEHGPSCTGTNLHVMKEKVMGSRSEVTIACKGCGKYNTVKTARDDVNELLVATSMSAGLHHTGLGKVFLPLGCSIMAPRTYDRLQHVVGLKILKLAVASCRFWAEQEKHYAAESGMPSINGFQTVAGEGDACYAKRSRGTNYSSLSGGAVVLGHITKRVLDFEICQAHCQKCTRAKNQQVEPPDHNCPMNFSGSASQMEPELLTRIFKRSKSFNGLIISKFIADGDASVLPALRRNKVYIDEQVYIRKILCKLHVLRNLIKHLRDVINSSRLGSSSFKEQLLRGLGYLEGKLLALIEEAYNNGNDEIMLKQQLECAVRHHFGRHNLCPPQAKCQVPTNREIVTDPVFEKIMSITTTSLLCYTPSLLENCDTNQVEAFNNKQAELTGGKRINFSLSWAWIYRFGLSVLSWNSSDQDAVAMFIELAKEENISECHEKFNTMRAKKRFDGESYQRPDHGAGIRTYLKEGSIDPLSFDSEFLHPYAAGELNSERVAQQEKAGYSNTDRGDLSEKELYQERDRILWFILRAHADRINISLRTVNRHDNEEFVNIRSRVVTSDKIFMICKFVGGNKETRVESWPNKLYNVLGGGGVRFSDRFIVEQLMKEKMLDWLENHLATAVTRIGTILHPEYPFLEGSPSAFIREDKTVEAYFLFDQRHKMISDAANSVKWLTIDPHQSFSINPASEEYAKIQGDLACSARAVCIVVISTDLDRISFEVFFDEPFWSSRLSILADFFYFGLVEQADPMKSRSLPPRKYNSISEICESEKWRTWP